MAGAAAMVRWGLVPGTILVLGLAAVVLALTRRPRATVAALRLLAFGVGMLRAATHESAQPPSVETFKEGFELRLTGRIVRLPDSDKRRPLTLDIQSAAPGLADSPSADSGDPREVGGRVHVYSFSRSYFEGQILEVSGILRLYDPPPINPARFPIGRIDRPLVQAPARAQPDCWPDFAIVSTCRSKRPFPSHMRRCFRQFCLEFDRIFLDR